MGDDFDFKTEADRLLIACRFLADLNLDELASTVESTHSTTGPIARVARLVELAQPLAAEFRDAFPDARVENPPTVRAVP